MNSTRFPSQLTVGDARQATLYQLAQDQLLVQVAEGADEQELAVFLEDKQFESDHPLAEAGRARSTLEPAGLRWVMVPAQYTSAEVAESVLTARSDIADVKPVYYETGGGPESAATPMLDTLIVHIAEDQREAAFVALDELELERNVAASERLRPYHLFNVPAAVRRAMAETGQDLVESVAEAPGVISVDFDWLKLETYHFVPNDLYYRYQWNMMRIDAPSAWDVESGATDVWLAIIDSGFDLDHPDLSFAPNSAPKFTHFNADDALAGKSPPYYAGPIGAPHGTAVAGIAAASSNNDVGVAGMAGGCRIMPVCLGILPTATRVALGLFWAADHGAHVANLAFSTVPTTLANYAVDYAADKGVVLCAAAGNGGLADAPAPISFPARHSDTIAVGALNESDERKRPTANDPWWGSQFGPELDVVAPGVRIWTTDELGTAGYNAGGNYFSRYFGTSAATALVSGVAALMRSANRALTRRQVCDLIKSTCDVIGPSRYAFAEDKWHPHGVWNEEVGYGRVNAARAITAAAARPQSIGVAPNGDFVVVWADDSDRDGYFQIWARGFAPDGTDRFGPLTVNSVASGQQLKPVVAVDPNGNFVVVWEDDKDQNGYYQIMARGFDANGRERFPDVTINTDPIGHQLKPAVAMASDGSFVVVWEDDNDLDGNYEIMARGFDAVGRAQYDDITVNSDRRGQQLKPSVAMASEGDFVVVWQDDSDENGDYEIMARGFFANGLERFHDMTVNSDQHGQQLNPTVAMTSDRGFVVVWEDDRDDDGNFEIVARGFNVDGRQRFPDVTINAESNGQQLKPALAIDPDDRFVVVWQDDNDENGIAKILARGFKANGIERFPDTTVNSMDGGQKLEPAVAMDAVGRFFVSWQDDEDKDCVYRAFARGFSAGGVARFGDIEVC